MTDSLRVALLLDPLTLVLDDPLGLRVKWGDHAPMLARELLGRGHTVRGFGAPPGLIPRSGDDVQPDGTPSASQPGLRGRLRAFEPDVIVAYDALSPAAFRGAHMARRLRAGLVLVEAGLPQGGRFHEHCLRRVGEWLWGRYVRHATGGVIGLDVVGRSQALREGFASEITSIVPQGVDLTQFRPGLTSTLVTRHKIRGRILLYVGRLEANRGLQALVPAFARTVGQRADWNLVLAGDGSWRSRLRAMVERLGIAARVHWLARPRTEEIPGLMGASTLLAVPARDDVVMGRQIGRALACGLPVLASDIPRFRGHVQHEETGLLVEPGSIDGWTEAIRRATSSPTARARWAAAGRRVAEERYSWSAVASRIEEVLFDARRAVAERGRRRTVRLETEGRRAES